MYSLFQYWGGDHPYIAQHLLYTVPSETHLSWKSRPPCMHIWPWGREGKGRLRKTQLYPIGFRDFYSCTRFYKSPVQTSSGRGTESLCITSPSLCEILILFCWLCSIIDVCVAVRQMNVKMVPHSLMKTFCRNVRKWRMSLTQPTFSLPS